jgi:hypothetical protein
MLDKDEDKVVESFAHSVAQATAQDKEIFNFVSAIQSSLIKKKN